MRRTHHRTYRILDVFRILTEIKNFEEGYCKKKSPVPVEIDVFFCNPYNIPALPFEAVSSSKSILPRKWALICLCMYHKFFFPKAL